ncbi:MAG: hypothetical protein IKX47_03035 [Oscillospiraceae bacterium]|nr:hypothetical protein [Oscillospiraceae bacterium]
MKKALLLLTIFVLLLLAACGKATSAAETPAPTETPIPTETSAPAETPVPTAAPTPFEAPETITLPQLTLTSNAGKTEALLDTAHWTYRNGKGEEVSTEKIPPSQIDNFQDTDWYSLDNPFLYADGAVHLSFNMREPDDVLLYAFTDLGMVPVELEDWTFTPYAGLNTYFLTGTWDWVKEGGSGACRYVFMIEGAETNAPAVTETEELRLTVTQADAYGCAITLEDLGERPYNPTAMDDSGNPYALLRRTAAGGWEWIKPIRHFQGNPAQSLNKEESLTWAWDWSHSYGVLPAGDYALLLRGSLGRGTAKETVFLRGEFTIADTEPRGSGPLAFCPMPEEMENTLEKRSDHRWLQTLSTAETGWVVETDYSLFRVTHAGEKDEEWEYIPPEYHLPEMQNHAHWLLYGGRSRAYDVDLAARYGELPAGTYVLRRRFLKLSSEELEDAAFSDYRNWRLIPEDRVVYGDTWLTLRYALWDVPRGVDPMDERVPPYNGEASPLLISTAGSVFTSTLATVQLENLNTAPAPILNVEADYYYLYFFHQGEWYPVEHKRVSVHGLIGANLTPGEARKLSFRFTDWYGELPAGTYRMVITCYSEPFGEDAGFVVCEFKIGEDGSGEWQGLDEAENLVWLYGKQQVALYDLPLEGDWFYRPGPTWRSDPYVQSWGLERQGDKLTVTVWRDRDYREALALLGSNPQVELVKKETPYTTGSPVREGNSGAGTLSATLLEQESPLLDPEGTWVLSLTWEGEETVELLPDAFWFVNLEEYDPETETWRKLPMTVNFVHLAVGYGFTVSLEPGKTVNVFLASLAWYKAELSREKEYRFALKVDGLGWFTCPLPLGQYEKAATEEEIEALRQDYPLMDVHVMSENALLGKPLADYFSRLAGNENYDFFYAEAEYLGKGPSSESYIHKALRFRIRDVICGAVEAIPWEYLDEDRSSVVCYSTALENNMGVQTLPDFREGERYILGLALPRTEVAVWQDYPNAIHLMGQGEVYYVTEGDLIMPTQYFREEYAGYSRKTFKRLLRELYEETLSRSGT